MISDRVCAIVVSFHPDEKVHENLALLRDQTDAVVVVDNGSSDAEVVSLRAAAQSLDLVLIENGANLGIATALNQGIRWAIGDSQASHFDWIILFDQDSRVTPGFVATLVAAFQSSPWGEKLGILVPIYTDNRFGVPIRSNKVRHGLEAAMTSGSLLRAETFTHCGFFIDALFIDGVDYEFSLRLRRRGYIIDECPNAVLLHSPGEPIRHKLLGFNYQTANYSPIRRYYQERNKVWIARRYFLRFPVFCAKLFFFSVKDFTKILIAEDNKPPKIRYFLRGLLDGLRERMGKLASH